MSEMVERVARALQRDDFETANEADAVWNDQSEPDPYKESYRSSARAAIAAMREPTALMLFVARKMEADNEHRWVKAVGHDYWEAMIDAALAEPAS
jgi:hypothetical protein